MRSGDIKRRFADVGLKFPSILDAKLTCGSVDSFGLPVRSDLLSYYRTL